MPHVPNQHPPGAERISVDLVLFNPKADEQPAEEYRRYWHATPKAIFA